MTFTFVKTGSKSIEIKIEYTIIANMKLKP